MIDAAAAANDQQLQTVTNGENCLDAIERAIRNAFEKGNSEDRSFREKVYRQAFAALDRAMQAHPNLTVEAAIGRRKTLQAMIASIETEFLPAAAAQPEIELEVVDQAADNDAEIVPSVEAPGPLSSAASAPAPVIESDLARSSAAAPGLAPQRPSAPSPSIDVGERAASPARASTSSAADIMPDRADARLRAGERRRPLAAMFFAVTVLTAAGMGGWWAYQTGLLKSPAERDTAVRTAPQTVVEEDFTPEEDKDATPLMPGAADQERNWITVFSPDDPTLVSAPADAKAGVMEDESGSFLRIRSGASGSAIIFDVGQGILEQLTGKKAVFDIVARAAEGQETQISVSCEFGELGDCGRKRYVVGYQRGEYLFEIELPARKPGASGTIAINSDFANEGKAVDIYEIRVSAAK